MSDVKPGTLIDATAQRDAIHIALAPVVAAETLYPGQHIGFVEGSTEVVAPIADGPRAAQNKPAIGIVDPFLCQRVQKGEHCWMFLYPQTITSLRHDWTHPAFEPSKATAEHWLRNFCASNDCPSYEEVMQAIKGELEDDMGYGRWGYIDHNYFHFSGRDAHSEIPPEFWDHVETVLGRKMSARPSSFSCSC